MFHIDSPTEGTSTSAARSISFASATRTPEVLASTKSGSLEIDEDEMLTDEDPGSAKNHGLSATSAPYIPSGAAQPSPSSEGDMIEVKQEPGAYQLPLDHDQRGKLKNKYMMADGTVVNGKGLGRGRPGFKRGPRKSALSKEVVEDSDSDSGSPATPASVAVSSAASAGQPNRATPIKRKRTVSDVVATNKVDADDDDTASRASTPEYNPTASTQTRSGRQSQKPITIVDSTPRPTPVKRPSLAKTISSPSVKRHPKIKAKVYRGREQFALCEHCLRSNGPPGNLIVFCDACNKCWHQRCHEPRIAKEVIADTKAEWFCADCDRILHGKKRPKAVPRVSSQAQSSLPPQQPASAVPSPASNLPPLRYGMPWIPGMSLTLDQQKAYLNSQPKEKLIDIVLRAAQLAPNMPIFETPYLLVNPAPQFPPLNNSQLPPHMLPPQLAMPPPPLASAPNAPRLNSLSRDGTPIYDHPTAGIPSKPNTQPPKAGEEVDEGYYDDFDEMALLYPKPGEGVYDSMLPPESSDLGILLEGSDCKNFSHWVRGRGEIPWTLAPLAAR